MMKNGTASRMMYIQSSGGREGGGGSDMMVVTISFPDVED